MTPISVLNCFKRIILGLCIGINHFTLSNGMRYEHMHKVEYMISENSLNIYLKGTKFVVVVVWFLTLALALALILVYLALMHIFQWCRKFGY